MADTTQFSRQQLELYFTKSPQLIKAFESLQKNVLSITDNFSPLITNPVVGDMLVYDGSNWVNKRHTFQNTPILYDVSVTLSDDSLLNGLILANPNDPINFTLPSTIPSLVNINDAIEWCVINRASNNAHKITIIEVAENSYIGFNEIAHETSARFKSVKVSDNLYKTYRIS